jgi:hypothetical protein
MNTYKVTVTGQYDAADRGAVERFLLDTVQPEAERGGFRNTALVSIEQVATARPTAGDAVTPRNDVERRAVEAALAAVRNTG